MTQAMNLVLNLRTQNLYPNAADNERQLNVDLSQDILAITGDSGAGKTTLLQGIAGINSRNHSKASTGFCCQLNKQSMVNIPVSHNPCVYVGADTPLVDHISLRQNLALTRGLSQWMVNHDKLAAHFGILPVMKGALSAKNTLFSIDTLIDVCELKEFIDKPCYQLSGGETQRGQLARALICGKPILLLDEALSAMDAQLRTRIQLRLKSLHQQQQRCIVLVSHSRTEVLSLSDKVVVLSRGDVVFYGDTFTEGAWQRYGKEQADGRDSEMEGFVSTLKVRHLRDDTEHGLSVYALGHNKEKSAEQTAPKIYCKRLPEADKRERLLISSSQIALTKQAHLQSSMLNQLSATVSQIEAFENSAMISMSLNGQSMKAHISKKSLSDLALNIGDEVQALFKAL